MKRKTSSHASINIVVVLASFLIFSSGCGSDKVAPADPSSTSVIPDIVFFNTGAASPKVLFEGRATDNTRVDSVSISFDNGTNWHTAVVDTSSPNKLWNVSWSYLASETDMPAVMNTVRIKAVDGEGNEAISSPIKVEKQNGATAGSLLAAFFGAGPGDVIALSSGSGGAYGNGSSGLTIPIDVNLTVLGSGYGNGDTSGGLTFPDGSSTATVINSGLSASSIFSVDADLTLKKMRILGAREGISINDVPEDHDPQLVVEDCVFDGQDSWAVSAVDDDEGAVVQFLSSFVDASSATSTSRGGLYLEGVQYLVQLSEFYYQKDPGGPEDDTVQGAGVQAVGGVGDIIDSIFDDNTLAIWASGGEAKIDSCSLNGMAGTTNGLLYTGSTTLDPEISYSHINSNSGFGVKIKGQIPLIFLHNSISGNGSGGINEGGVIIDYNFTNTNTAPILGDCQAYNICVTGGRNSIFDNYPFDATVTANGSTYIPIKAEGNWWGPDKVVTALVDVLIQDGDTNTAPGSEDYPLDRAYLDFRPWDSTSSDPND